MSTQEFEKSLGDNSDFIHDKFSSKVREKMNKKTRSVRVTNNPVASASEYKRFIENIYSHLLGLSVNNSTRRSKLDGSFGKGAFGTSICAYGVHETQNRGSLHHHLILWGSIPPSLLQKAVEEKVYGMNLQKFWSHNTNVKLI